jgi:hypothetical protein
MRPTENVKKEFSRQILSFLGPKKSVKNKELFFLLLIKFVGRREREKIK